MVDKDKVSLFLEELIDILTLRRLALLTLLVSMLIVMLTVFENRTAAFSMVYKSSEPETSMVWDLSSESEVQLSGLTESTSSLVGAVILTDVDLKKNRRSVKYSYVKNSITRADFQTHLEKLLPQALFDYDQRNTEQMVSMLNNEFLCYPSKETHFTRLLSSSIIVALPYACRIAVPPFFGEFAGYLTAMLTRAPTADEVNALKIEMNRVAIETYLRDISKKSKKKNK